MAPQPDTNHCQAVPVSRRGSEIRYRQDPVPWRPSPRSVSDLILGRCWVDRGLCRADRHTHTASDAHVDVVYDAPGHWLEGRDGARFDTESATAFRRTEYGIDRRRTDVPRNTKGEQPTTRHERRPMHPRCARFRSRISEFGIRLLSVACRQGDGGWRGGERMFQVVSTVSGRSCASARRGDGSDRDGPGFATPPNRRSSLESTSLTMPPLLSSPARQC